MLLAADGAATRAIGRALGCTTGTASKWRVRYAKDRLAGFSEVGSAMVAITWSTVDGDRRFASSRKAAYLCFVSSFFA